MTPVRKWSGYESRALREALRMSVREFAAHLGASDRTVSKWEAGGQAVYPRPVWQAVLDTVAQRASEEVQARFELLLSAPIDRTDRPAVPSDPVSRRTLVAGGLVAAALPAVRLEDLNRIVAALEDARRYFDGPVVDYLRQQLAACADNDGALGPRNTLPKVLGIVGVIDSSVRQVKPSVQRELLTVGAHGAEFAGWLYRDIGAPAWADYWRDRAMEWAQAAADTAMQGYILLKKSQSAWDTRDAVRMLTLAQAVQDGPWGLADRVRAEAAQQEARGHAMLGADLDVVERKLDEARRIFAGDGSTAEPGSHYVAPLLAMQTALCYQEAGLPQRAIEIYDDQLSRQVFSRRDYGYFLSLKGGALAAVHAPDQAADLGLQALAVAAATDSVRTMRELDRLVTELKPWAGRSRVRELSDAVLAL
ncbi:MAG: hypothetical protein AUI14_06150 [Actinobacteria bacterium 13_2_20CM_2_71_6]|nr:MAG: hypothetical protein AUI14_06150 [Actinobacteria bacterium 13_2_20CM_2_71_6]